MSEASASPADDDGAVPDNLKKAFENEVTPLDIPPYLLSLDSNIVNSEQLAKVNELLIEKILENLQEVDVTIQKKIEALESLDVTIQIVDYKIYEATDEFKTKIKEIKTERDQLLTSAENKSELSLIIHNMDQKILDLEKELDDRIREYNREKIDYQEKAEALMFQLDEDFSHMEERLVEAKNELEGKTSTMYKAQVILINQKYAPSINEFETHLLNYGKLQTTGWKMEHSQMRLSGLLLEKGLTFTPSGKLLTRAGSSITFHEATHRGYFADFRLSLEEIIQFFKERDQQQTIIDQVAQPDTDVTTEGGSVESKMSSEDVRYLKQHIGKPLALGLAEIITKYPRDPIHYLGHYLFKYRYNQELEEIQKKQIDELTKERKIVAQEMWRRFVEEEARNAVIEMVLRAEQIAYENELKRIEEEQMMAEEEEEGREMEGDLEARELLEEAKDKFE